VGFNEFTYPKGVAIQTQKTCQNKKKRPVLYTENGPKAKKAYPKTSLDKLI